MKLPDGVDPKGADCAAQAFDSLLIERADFQRALADIVTHSVARAMTPVSEAALALADVANSLSEAILSKRIRPVERAGDDSGLGEITSLLGNVAEAAPRLAEIAKTPDADSLAEAAQLLTHVSEAAPRLAEMVQTLPAAEVDPPKAATATITNATEALYFAAEVMPTGPQLVCRDVEAALGFLQSHMGEVDPVVLRSLVAKYLPEILE